MKDELRLTRCCLIGQVPQMLKRPEDDVKVDLENSILRSISEGTLSFVSGLDRGVGIWAAEIVLRLKRDNPSLHLIAAVPCPGFDEAWEDAWSRRYRTLLSQAEYVRVMEPVCSAEAFRKRVQWMVTHSARAIAVYNGQAGETRDLIRCARLCRIPVLILPG